MNQFCPRCDAPNDVELAELAFAACWECGTEFEIVSSSPRPSPPLRGREGEADRDRARFEEWISAAPYERSVERWPQDEKRHSWPGQYKDIAVQLAWEAVMESKKAE
jgi:hypothetical protein